jgi:hypothetical protein
VGPTLLPTLFNRDHDRARASHDALSGLGHV